MNYHKEIKQKLINNEITKRVKDYSKNRSDLNTYYNVGKLLFEAGKHYGKSIIKEYSIKMVIEVGRKYYYTLLKNARSFYYMIQKSPTMSDFLTKNIKRIEQDKTIGIIICKKDNKFIMEYCSDDRIYQRMYELTQQTVNKKRLTEYD